MATSLANVVRHNDSVLFLFACRASCSLWTAVPSPATHGNAWRLERDFDAMPLFSVSSLSTIPTTNDGRSYTNIHTGQLQP